ncbi:hypothetical protein H4R34_001869 [Dimargaris verticillata]|uniref:Uncharacterized protein n=1 Tax=Dimargaris verticillata TaxID=2761393 RepID=A0A9W8B4S2_9FUNG|nr:hypothetical protein H4R34_001869 [Dimargaris verticillata]
MVLLTITPRMAQMLQQAHNSTQCPPHFQKSLAPYMPGATHDDNEHLGQAVAFETLWQAYQCLKSTTDSLLDGDLAHILAGVAVYQPPPVIKEKDPAFQAHLDKIKLELAQKEYMTMVSGVAVNERHRMGSTIAQEMKQVNQNLTVVINIAFSIVAVFVSVMWWGKASVPDPGMQ